ncbi:hypothetical protein [Porphyromonas levii]|uniref:hypothetical protein n=1 Tax=Porphyromonas levii TaxID=28114 RepID=UPI00037FE621|nr:hypothetical protein [Porphyromonas levii]
MAEKIRARRRVKEGYIGDPITSETELGTATFETKLPLTLRDDELTFSQEDPEKEEVYTHEMDSPVYTDYVMKPVVVSGTFLGLTDDQKKLLLGGEVKGGKYFHNSTIPILVKSLKWVDHAGNYIICTNVSGYVKYEPSIGKKGLDRYPFKFTCMAGAPDWDVDIVEGPDA